MVSVVRKSLAVRSFHLATIVPVMNARHLPVLPLHPLNVRKYFLAAIVERRTRRSVRLLFFKDLVDLAVAPVNVAVMVNVGLKAHKDLEDLRDPKDPKVPKVAKVLKAPLVSLDLRDAKDLRDLRVFLVLRVLRVLKVAKDLRVRRDLVVALELVVNPVNVRRSFVMSPLPLVLLPLPIVAALAPVFSRTVTKLSLNVMVRRNVVTVNH